MLGLWKEDYSLNLFTDFKTENLSEFLFLWSMRELLLLESSWNSRLGFIWQVYVYKWTFKDDSYFSIL